MSTAVFPAPPSRRLPLFALAGAALASPLMLGALGEHTAPVETPWEYPAPALEPLRPSAATRPSDAGDAPRATADRELADPGDAPTADDDVRPDRHADRPRRLTSQALERFLDTLDPPALPRALRTEVARAVSLAADGSGVDPLLLLAVIRVESGFDVNAVSPRGALGLMQVLPTTAAPILAAHGALEAASDAPPDVASADPAAALLSDPEVNIAVGTEYLVELQARYDGDLTRALAAYNAGPRRLRERAAETGESIPEAYEAYARRVLRTWRRYQRAQASNAVAWLAAPAPATTATP